MAQLTRLHESDMVTGNIIVAAHHNAELNQMLGESNSQDTRLNTIESGSFTKTGLMAFGTIPVLPASDPTTANQAVRKAYVDALVKAGLNGLAPVYTSSNVVTIPSGGFWRDDTNAQTFTVNSNITVTISTSGAGGLDTGSEASNTWYYIWLIGKTDSGGR